MPEIRLAKPERRDQKLLIGALAMVLQKMLGAAAEVPGMDRLLNQTLLGWARSRYSIGCRR